MKRNSGGIRQARGPKEVTGPGTCHVVYHLYEKPHVDQVEK